MKVSCLGRKEKGEEKEIRLSGSQGERVGRTGSGCGRYRGVRWEYDICRTVGMSCLGRQEGKWGKRNRIV